MEACPWPFINDTKKHIISLVGGGGKTTIMYELANYYAAASKRVVVFTTTHIWLPRNSAAVANGCNACGAYAADLSAVQRLWQQGGYAVIGTLE